MKQTRKAGDRQSRTQADSRDRKDHRTPADRRQNRSRPGSRNTGKPGTEGNPRDRQSRTQADSRNTGKPGGIEKRAPGKPGHPAQNSGERAGNGSAVRKPHKKEAFPKPGNMLYPIPAVMVTCQDADGNNNIITVAWTGTICSDPPMLSISVRKERYSYALIRESGEFVVNLTTRRLARHADYCGVKSGRDVDKFSACGLHPSVSRTVAAPGIEESPVSLECRVREVIELGTHDLFLAEVLCVQVDTAYMDAHGRFSLEDTDLVAYSHGTYYALGEELGRFGFSVQKKKKAGKR